MTAGEWAQSTCGAVGVWRGEIEDIVEELRTPSAFGASGAEEPQSETPQGRTGFVRVGLERAVQATDTMVEGIDNAGTPDTPRGRRQRGSSPTGPTPPSTISRRRRTRSTRRRTRSRSRSTQLTDAARAIGAALASGVQTIAEVARTDPELAAALQESSTCQQLREETS